MLILDAFRGEIFRDVADPSLVQGAGWGFVHTTSAVNTYGSNLIIACLNIGGGAGGGVGQTTMSDTYGNPWQLALEDTTWTLNKSGIFYCYWPIVGPNHEFSWTLPQNVSGTFWVLVLQVIGGPGNTTTVGPVANNRGVSITQTPPAPVTPVLPGVVIAFLAGQSGGPIGQLLVTPGSIIREQNVPSFYVTAVSIYAQLVPAAVNVVYNWTSPAIQQILVASFPRP